jgi:Tetratricopeptide repeat
MQVRYNVRTYPPPIGAKRLMIPVGMIVLALDVLPAHAQTKAKPTGQESESKATVLTHATIASPIADLARTLVKQGNCAKALDLFDQALQTSQTPTVVRDRGLCHEKLGHVFPAREDFRRYLAESPEARDADDIRTRLDSLNGVVAQAPQETSGGGTSASQDRAPLSAKVSINSSSKQEASDRQGMTIAEVASVESNERSPLRLGTGIVIAPYLGLRRSVGSGSSTDLGYMVGGSFRYATGSVLSLLAELGYTAFGRNGRGGSSGGVQTFLGLEGRFKLDERATNQLFVHFGPGYERLTASVTKSALNVLFIPRMRLGYRHVFGPAMALELAADGGPFYYFVSNLPSGATGDTSGVRAMVAGEVALAIAF